ncbi:MAG: phenylacetate-CoA ligase [Bacteriovoracaceae bacterium]|jgi:phenylacetate-CoA ligase
MINFIKAYALYPLLEKQQKRDIRSKIKELNQFADFSREELENHRKESLYNIVKYSSIEVPYYKDLFHKIDFKPEKIKNDIKYFEDIPFINKDTIIQEKSRLLATKLLDQPRFGRKTGGSTGSAVHIFYDQTGLDWTAAVNLHALSQTGRNHHDLEVHLSSKFNDNPPLMAKAKEVIKCLGMNRKNIFTSSLEENDLKNTYLQLLKLKPFLVQGHPSTLYALAIYIQNSGLPFKKLFNAFESTGESIDNKKVQTIEKNLGCKVYNRYGNAEFGVIAHSKESISQLEILNRIVHIENFTLEESLSEIVITNYTNKLMPLLRYRTGDLGKVIKMGSKDYIINLEGRIHDLIKIKDKTFPTHYIQDVLDRIGGIDEFQIIEHKDKTFTLKLVPNQNKDLIKSPNEVNNQLKSFFDADIDIEYTNFESLAKCGWRDKFRYLIKE